MTGLNHYSEVLNYVRQTALGNDSVNEVVQGDFETIDYKKMNVRPFVWVNITGASLSNGSTVNMNIQMGAFSDRIENKEIDPSYFNNDNEVDNMNTTLAIINSVWTEMYLGFENADIIASDSPRLEPSFDAALQLDGWIINFDLEMPNTNICLCSCN